MSNQILQLVGSTTFPAIISMAFVSLRRRPGDQPIPTFASGGLVLFLKTWMLALICALVFGPTLAAVGASESFASGF
jgi:hypothetical protein